MWQVDSRGGIIKVAKSTQTTPQQQLRARQQHFQLYQFCCLFLSKLLGKQEQKTQTTKKKPSLRWLRLCVVRFHRTWYFLFLFKHNCTRVNIPHTLYWIYFTSKYSGLIIEAHESIVQPIPLWVTFSNVVSKLKAQSSNVSFHWNVTKETFELWAFREKRRSSFEHWAFENVTPSGIGCNLKTGRIPGNFVMKGLPRLQICLVIHEISELLLSAW